MVCSQKMRGFTNGKGLQIGMRAENAGTTPRNLASRRSSRYFEYVPAAPYSWIRL